jgi:hypothetical protein
MIAVATRWSRRDKQTTWIAQVTKDQVDKYSKKYRNWQEKLYASLFFKVIDKVLAAEYEIHIDKELPISKTQIKVHKYLRRLFGIIHSGDIRKENPKISFHTKKKSEYVKHADRKGNQARRETRKIDEKKTSLDWLMKLLDC